MIDSITTITFHYVSYFAAFDWRPLLLDTSSMVHFSSTPLFTPANLFGLGSPERSVPRLLIQAPLGGLGPSPIQRL